MAVATADSPNKPIVSRAAPRIASVTASALTASTPSAAVDASRLTLTGGPVNLGFEELA